jgi:nitrile hydratase subunit alpha
MQPAHTCPTGPPTPERVAEMAYHVRLETAVRELLIERGVLTQDDVDRAVADIDEKSSALGAKLVARAWVDSAFKERLLADANAACAELGIPTGNTKLLVVENTAETHNLIVCTLCSCYPRVVLGLPPDWYKSREYRCRAVREPRAVLREFGTAVPDGVTVRVHDSNADMRYLVLPVRPAGTEGMSEDELRKLVTRDSMVGVTMLGV